MKKIPTLFERAFDNHKIVDITNKITPGCEEAKALGNKGNYYNEFKKWLPEEEEFKSCSECKYKYTHIWQTPCKNCYDNGRPNWEKKND